jgi:metal-sulfur cluster biosynthetic enzyme
MTDQNQANSEQTKRDPGRRQRQALERRVQNAMTTIYDPATPNIDLFNMGMIYAVRIEMPAGAGPGAHVELDLAYSSPGHPGNIGLVQRVESTVRELEGVEDCKVNVVSDPPWTLDRVSDHARVNMSVVN